MVIIMKEFINFNKCPCIYWKEKTKIEYLQRMVIVHSILYYELNESCIKDSKFDILSKQLVRMQNDAELNVLESTMYYYCLNDFDGTTGFDIYSKLNKKDKKYLMHIATLVLEKYNQGNGIKKKKEKTK